MKRVLNLMRMMLTWWHSQTLGTAWHTFTRGRLVGADEQGNRYFEDKGGRSINGKPRRWVVYNGDVEASRVPPVWHGWLHYTQDLPPAEAGQVHRDWHKPHQINLTGTKSAHTPKQTKAASLGYKSWDANVANGEK